MKACIVVPTIREKNIQEFLDAWDEEFTNHWIIVVEDNPERSFDIIDDSVQHVSWKEIDRDLGEDSWIIPRRSGAIRNYGLLEAKRWQPDMIVMLDDDCLPTHKGVGFLERHWHALESVGSVEPLYDGLSTFIPVDKKPTIHARGFPRELRRIRTMLNHGLWDQVADLDGLTQTELGSVNMYFPQHSLQIAHGTLFPMSAMNVAFRPELTPAMYQMPMGQGQPYHRFDDIWCGWIMKKACDAMGWAVRSGSPCIRHVRASDAASNAKLEAPGMLENERVFRAVLDMQVNKRDLHSCLESIHAGLRPLGSYWVMAYEASAIWRRLVRQ